MSNDLKGLKVLVLRPEEQADEFADLLRAEGAEPVAIPAVRILPPGDWAGIDDALRRSGDFDWVVFTSVNGVRTVIGRLESLGGDDLNARVAAIGPATRSSLEEAGIRVDWMPASFTTRALAEQLPPAASGLEQLGKSGDAHLIEAGSNQASSRAPTRVCLFRADIAGDELERILEKRGFTVERVNAYRTQAIHGEKIAAALMDVNAVAFTSASIVDSFAGAAGDRLPQEIAVVSIGPATSEACLRHGITVHAEAKDHTAAGLVEVMKDLKR